MMIVALLGRTAGVGFVGSRTLQGPANSTTPLLMEWGPRHEDQQSPKTRFARSG